MKTLWIHPDAERELSEAAEYYKSRQATLGQDLYDEVFAIYERILANPKSFSCHHTRRTRKTLVHRFPYTIYFREHRSRIRIMAVAHQSRKPDYWARRK